jgi:hypothetical protein
MNNTKVEPINIIKALNSVLIYLYPDYISVVKKQFFRSSKEIVIHKGSYIKARFYLDESGYKEGDALITSGRVGVFSYDSSLRLNKFTPYEIPFLMSSSDLNYEDYSNHMLMNFLSKEVGSTTRMQQVFNLINEPIKSIESSYVLVGSTPYSLWLKGTKHKWTLCVWFYEEGLNRMGLLLKSLSSNSEIVSKVLIRTWEPEFITEDVSQLKEIGLFSHVYKHVVGKDKEESYPTF